MCDQSRRLGHGARHVDWDDDGDRESTGLMVCTAGCLNWTATKRPSTVHLDVAAHKMLTAPPLGRNVPAGGPQLAGRAVSDISSQGQSF